jgi:1-acyl-sn-glycerol-3-phosphate acyltransferase
VKAAVCLVITLPLMPLQWLLVRLHWPQARTLPLVYHRLLCRILGLSLKVDGKVVGPGLIVSNHMSWLDIIVLSAVHPVSFVAKKEVGTWLFFGALARLQRTIFVDRERRRATLDSTGQIRARLKAGDTLVLFPEGTSSHGRRLKPFKSSFVAAVEGGAIPLIPLSLSYLSQHGLPLTSRQRPHVAWYGDMELLPHLWAILRGGPIDVRVNICPPLLPSAFSGRKALSAAAAEAIGQSLHGGGKIG